MIVTVSRVARNLVLIASAAVIPATTLAQAYPARPIRMVIAFPPGGPTDIVSRIFAQRLGEQMNQQVVVENRPGAGGNLAAEQIARSPADGYTLFYNTSAITIGPALYAKVNYDPLKDFAPVGLAATVPLVLLVNPQIPARDLAQFIDFARSRPAQLNYGSSGSGTITHLAAALFSRELGIQAQHVPYKGSAPAMADTASGQLQFMIDTINSTLPFIRDGRLRALAVATRGRSSLLPDLPTFHETVLPNFEMSAWQGIVVPAGTPQPIIDRLNVELNRALASTEVRGKLAAQGTEPLGGSPAEYAAYMRSELARWARVVRDANARVE